MADHIPFMTGDDGVRLLKAHFSDSSMIRIPLDRAEKLIGKLPPSSSFWIDPCVDGLDDLESRKNSWIEFMKDCSHFDKIGSPGFHSKPVMSEVQSFVNAIMNKCAAYRPSGITVPQIPLIDGSERNKINRALADATGTWKSDSNFQGKLIIPLIATHKDHFNGKKARTPKIQQAERCYNDSNADGTWVVDQSVLDESGSVSLRSARFASVISFHEELNEKISGSIRIAGPYWGLNLVLWARGLVTHPAIGLGSGYQYFLAGGQGSMPSVRIALPSLRRRVLHNETLRQWLTKAIQKLAPSHPAHVEFSHILHRFDELGQLERAKEQIAAFYKHWFNSIAAVPIGGRSMAMFQDLSASYALGKSLPEFSADEGAARKAESIAEALMMSCL